MSKVLNYYEELPKPEPIACPYCHGKGSVIVESTSIECVACDGFGYASEQGGVS